jgi:dTDP-glucose 4,6-dehydratase
LLVRSYVKTYGIPACITRCSNNYGSYQHKEKLIPLLISRAIKNETLPIYGDGLQIRDWLHVNDHCHAIAIVLEKGIPGEIYNIGGNNEWTNIAVTKKILKLVKKPESLITFVKDRPGHDRRYAIDASKINCELGWNPRYSFDEGLKETVEWYMENEKK